jgi:hypothetical protein
MADYRNLWATALGVAVLAGGALLGAHAGIASADDSPTGPDDPLCATMPADAVCQGGPFAPPAPAPPPPPALPTSAFDPVCATMPGDGVCAGGPYAPPPPPPMDSGLGAMGGPGAPDIPTAPIHPFGGMPEHPFMGHPMMGMHPGMGMGMPGHA